jgi:hypothetical protein
LLNVIAAAPLEIVSNVPEIVIVSPGDPEYLDNVKPVVADTGDMGSSKKSSNDINMAGKNRKTVLAFVNILPLIQTQTTEFIIFSCIYEDNIIIG